MNSKRYEMKDLPKLTPIGEELFQKLQAIGFAFEKTLTSEALGITTIHDSHEERFVSEYKYRPDYLADRHYTLVLFDEGYGAEFRLYSHWNDGTFKDSFFQIREKNSFWKRQRELGNDYVDKKLHELFPSELRDLRINELLA